MTVGIAEIDLGAILDLRIIKGADTVKASSLDGISNLLGSVEMDAFRNNWVRRALFVIRFQDERA